MGLTIAAHLYNRILVGGPAKERYESFAKAMFGAYGKRLREAKAVWLGDNRRGVYVQGLWTIFGQELVNAVTWGKKCTCQEKMCDHSKKAVDTGAMYIRHAKDGFIDTNTDEDSFLKPLYQEVPSQLGKHCGI